MTHRKDKCQACGGTRGGVPGNENIVNGRLLCDYCTVDTLLNQRPPANDTGSQPDA